ncbi:chemotaxis protein CheC [Azospirillum rugosum]|uniref:Chemotaxis protein CheC n=1 Tax=Azospirillum rugosum TaxID=416170 RepID=A0ABS4SJL2_9PROT|nr:chemotaxis protein CheC [Azospirillum rugosum]MBP2292414.1 chemotaxis protein CheC [Azospirillum rugosum]MDQ0526173.1 chemotaxis protein CheC [Azospirillum rugosum]
MPLLSLDPGEADAIAELFNIGMGQSAAALGDMLGEEVHLSVPSLSVSSRSRIAHQIAREFDADSAARVCAVQGDFSGPFTGQAMLIFPERGTLALVGRLMPVDPAASAPGEVELDALTEIGNIILNGCLASLSNLVESEVAGALPCCSTGQPAEIIGAADTDPILFVRIDVALASGDACGQVLFLLNIASLDGFREAIRKALANL